MTIEEYNINYCCDELENLAHSNILNNDIIKRIFVITKAARKYSRIKEALL